MKSIIEFIKEALQINEANLDLWKKTRESSELLYYIKNFCKSQKGKKISLNNENERRPLFNEFKSKVPFGDNKRNLQILSKYGLGTQEGFRGFFLSNHDNLEKEKIDIDWIKQFDLTEIEKEYQTYKKSKDYVQGRKGEDIDPEEVEERDLIVYDRWNPDTFEVFTFTGKRSKNNEKQVNMFRMDFHYDYDVKYYDCYPILAKNYFGHEEELKKRAEEQLGYEDPNEFDIDKD